MFGKIGMGELLVVLVIILLIFGPSKLPALAKSLGQSLREFRKGTQDLTNSLETFADEPVVNTTTLDQTKSVSTTAETASASVNSPS
ncbi:hypothetical protein AN639_10360 [Candidatus Epulonipiscium fishelsonii]|uniref:Uncharacterized protein n=1 Tax=Candidatus Epulonipiscium fishelsonii TaxID=77094 RepID=A0ACC8X9Z9_9FIRM|nr:hypothetical protein AN396_08980 [Epulopiscium sp. SCG-B11WGA-EpuloA1]ONI43497.1 hypothetical protein AN639_10360 [Epulopiscium sp. SCG-B05WGA-EpuloA1]